MGSISFRLRPDKDDDIIQALEKVPKRQEKSDIVRAALRQYFNVSEEIHTEFHTEPSMDAESKLNDFLNEF